MTPSLQNIILLLEQSGLALFESVSSLIQIGAYDVPTINCFIKHTKLSPPERRPVTAPEIWTYFHTTFKHSTYPFQGVSA